MTLSDEWRSLDIVPVMDGWEEREVLHEEDLLDE
jgi:hypothetical protein